MLEAAEEHFHKGWEYGHDDQYGGFYFALSPDKEVIDTDKNYWVIAEAIAASALLGAKTGKKAYWSHYEELFAYASTHFIDHKHGGWHKLVNRENERYSGEKSTAPKTDYHPSAACYQAIPALQ